MYTYISTKMLLNVLRKAAREAASFLHNPNYNVDHSSFRSCGLLQLLVFLPQFVKPSLQMFKMVGVQGHFKKLNAIRFY